MLGELSDHDAGLTPVEERGKERKLGEASKITVHSQEGLVRLSESEPNWAVRGVLCSPEMDLPAMDVYSS